MYHTWNNASSWEKCDSVEKMRPLEKVRLNWKNAPDLQNCGTSELEKMRQI